MYKIDIAEFVVDRHDTTPPPPSATSSSVWVGARATPDLYEVEPSENAGAPEAFDVVSEAFDVVSEAFDGAPEDFDGAFDGIMNGSMATEEVMSDRPKQSTLQCYTKRHAGSVYAP